MGICGIEGPRLAILLIDTNPVFLMHVGQSRPNGVIWPNFLIIGAPKAGTTSLYHYLNQHPEVYMSRHKEPHFFCFEGEQLAFTGPGDDRDINLKVTNVGDYLELFREVKGEKAIGEASTYYLYSEKALKQIKHYVPDVKLIVGLRNPIDRAFSSFRRNVQKGREPIADFRKALAQEERRKAENWFRGDYIFRSTYTPHLKRYIESFGRDRILIYLFDDLVRTPTRILKKVARFLGIDDTFSFNVRTKFNASQARRQQPGARPYRPVPVLSHLVRATVPPSIRVNILRTMEDWNNPKVEIPADARAFLRRTFRQDTLELQDLLGKDLSAWLT